MDVLSVDVHISKLGISSLPHLTGEFVSWYILSSLRQNLVVSVTVCSTVYARVCMTLCACVSVRVEHV